MSEAPKAEPVTQGRTTASDPQAGADAPVPVVQDDAVPSSLDDNSEEQKPADEGQLEQDDKEAIDEANIISQDSEVGQRGASKDVNYEEKSEDQFTKETSAVTQGQSTRASDPVPVLKDDGKIESGLDAGETEDFLDNNLNDATLGSTVTRDDEKAKAQDDEEAIDPSNIVSEESEVGQRKISHGKHYIEGEDENEFTPETAGRSAMHM